MTTANPACPVAANAFYLQILLPTLREKLGWRRRELQAWCLTLDLLARGLSAQAADLVAQRVKAIERSVVDGHWSRAQHLEIMPPDNSTFLDKGEDLMLAKEAELEQKLKGSGGHGNPSGHWWDNRGGGDGPKGKGKKGTEGKDKGSKGKGKNPEVPG